MKNIYEVYLEFCWIGSEPCITNPNAPLLKMLPNTKNEDNDLPNCKFSLSYLYPLSSSITWGCRVELPESHRKNDVGFVTSTAHNGLPWSLTRTQPSHQKHSVSLIQNTSNCDFRGLLTVPRNLFLIWAFYFSDTYSSKWFLMAVFYSTLGKP